MNYYPFLGDKEAIRKTISEVLRSSKRDYEKVDAIIDATIDQVFINRNQEATRIAKLRMQAILLLDLPTDAKGLQIFGILLLLINGEIEDSRRSASSPIKSGPDGGEPRP